MNLRIFMIQIVSMVLVGCCPSQFNTTNTLWNGTWYVDGNKNSVMVIAGNGPNVYAVNVKTPNAQWEGVGYSDGNKLAVVFRYSTSTDQGYITLRFESSARAAYTSYDTDGSYRSDGFVTR